MVRIIPAETADHYEEVKKLFTQYASSLKFDIEFQGFSYELSTLPGEYAPPFGCILLAENSDRFVGCVALRILGESACEMKRLFVVPKYRGTGIGKRLAIAVIEEARRYGYLQMRLDTVASMSEANALYVSIGFYPIEAYCHNPLDQAVFYELNLV